MKITQSNKRNDAIEVEDIINAVALQSTPSEIKKRKTPDTSVKKGKVEFPSRGFLSNSEEEEDSRSSESDSGDEESGEEEEEQSPAKKSHIAPRNITQENIIEEDTIKLIPSDEIDFQIAELDFGQFSAFIKALSACKDMNNIILYFHFWGDFQGIQVNHYTPVTFFHAKYKFLFCQCNPKYLPDKTQDKEPYKFKLNLQRISLFFGKPTSQEYLKIVKPRNSEEIYMSVISKLSGLETKVTKFSILDPEETLPSLIPANLTHPLKLTYPKKILFTMFDTAKKYTNDTITFKILQNEIDGVRYSKILLEFGPDQTTVYAEYQKARITLDSVNGVDTPEPAVNFPNSITEENPEIKIYAETKEIYAEVYPLTEFFSFIKHMDCALISISFGGKELKKGKMEAVPLTLSADLGSQGHIILLLSAKNNDEEDDYKGEDPPESQDNVTKTK